MLRTCCRTLLVANCRYIAPELRIAFYVKVVTGQVLPIVPVVFAVWLQVHDCGNFDIHSLGIHTADTTDTMNSTCMTKPWI